MILRVALAVFALAVILTPWPSIDGINVAGGAGFLAGALVWEAVRPALLGRCWK